MSEDPTIHQMILSQLERSEANQRRIFDKLDEQGKSIVHLNSTLVSQGSTLVRLTTTVEEHKNYSRNLELEQKTQRKQLATIDAEIENINAHVNEVKLWVKLLKPTRTKMVGAVLLASLLGGNEALNNPVVKNLVYTALGIPTLSQPAKLPVPSSDTEKVAP